VVVLRLAPPHATTHTTLHHTLHYYLPQFSPPLHTTTHHGWLPGYACDSHRTHIPVENTRLHTAPHFSCTYTPATFRSPHHTTRTHYTHTATHHTCRTRTTYVRLPHTAHLYTGSVTPVLDAHTCILLHAPYTLRATFLTRTCITPYAPRHLFTRCTHAVRLAPARTPGSLPPLRTRYRSAAQGRGIRVSMALARFRIHTALCSPTSPGILVLCRPLSLYHISPSFAARARTALPAHLRCRHSLHVSLPVPPTTTTRHLSCLLPLLPLPASLLAGGAVQGCGGACG